MSSRRLGLVSLVVIGLGFGTLALASGGDSTPRKEVARPVAVHPASEAPSSTFLSLQEQAIAQPRGEHRTGTTTAVPAIASPQR